MGQARLISEVLNDRQAARRLVALYLALVSEIDDAVGHILAELEALNMHENTLVVFVGARGSLIGNHGLTVRVIITAR